MTERAWVFLDPKVLLAVHDQQIAEHGGLPGVRSIELFESALARPRNVVNYGSPDVFDLAASYGKALACNHPFVDGNKRTAFVAMELFLALNVHQLDADDANCVLTVLDVASGTMDEVALADWLRRWCVVRGPRQ